MEKMPIRFPFRPYAPKSVRAFPQHRTLSSMAENITTLVPDPRIQKEIELLVEGWEKDPESVTPYATMSRLLDRVRALPPGNERTVLMVSIIKTLGKPKVLARFLDMLREESLRDTSSSNEMRAKLQNVKMHSIYGWCGNTLLVESGSAPTQGTYPAIPGLGERLGNSPSAWNLTIHVWQPNMNAKGFPVRGRFNKDTVQEPPHSHPFDFVSTVVRGDMKQSIYTPRRNLKSKVSGRYATQPLEHVDGVWPPHDVRETCGIDTLEESVPLKAGESYYMPCDWIHDVEINKSQAADQPTITLFLSSEYLVMPHVYMAPQMADFHEQNPAVKTEQAKAVSKEVWHQKLEALSAYLRGESKTLDLKKVVQYKGEYAFFHVSDK